MNEFKRCVGVIVINDKKEIALQLRAEHDDSFPSHWDFAAGGGIDEGENEKLSAEREVFEELGLKVEVEFVDKK